MYYKINNPTAKAILDEINEHLAQVEVKGDSVRHLFVARVGLTQILETLVPVEDEKGKEKEKERKEG